MLARRRSDASESGRRHVLTGDGERHPACQAADLDGGPRRTRARSRRAAAAARPDRRRGASRPLRRHGLRLPPARARRPRHGGGRAPAGVPRGLGARPDLRPRARRAVDVDHDDRPLTRHRPAATARARAAGSHRRARAEGGSVGRRRAVRPLVAGGRARRAAGAGAARPAHAVRRRAHAGRDRRAARRPAGHGQELDGARARAAACDEERPE